MTATMARAAALLLCLVASANQSVIAESIYGEWRLDVEHSDDVKAILKPAATKGKKATPDKHQQNAAPAAKASLLVMLAATRLTISKHADQVDIIPDKGEALSVLPDGRAAPVSLSDWGSSEHTPVRFSNWVGDTLVLESALDGGTNITQSYYVDSEGLLSQHTVINRSWQEPTTLKRLFQAVAADASIEEAAPK